MITKEQLGAAGIRVKLWIEDHPKAAWTMLAIVVVFVAGVLVGRA